jgi:SAM-dependent methyltransferase
VADAAPIPAPSSFFLEHVERLRDAGRLGAVVDLACGRGRHAIPAARAGLPIVGVDRSRPFLTALRTRAGALGEEVPCILADLEKAPALPLGPATCGAILVFRFLFRPLAPRIVEALAPGGILLYETFTLAQRERPYGPSNPDFLLAPGELPALFPTLEAIAHDERETGGPRPDAVARLLARKPPG